MRHNQSMPINDSISNDDTSKRDALIAAIDVGSNAMRLGIAAQAGDGTAKLIQRYREPVRLGHDAFTSGLLSRQCMDDAIEAFMQFRRIIDQHHIDRQHSKQLRAIATSAMRDAKNSHILIQRIQAETGITLQLISGEEEARLVHYSISRRIDLSGKRSLLVDMGGGSVEVTLCDDGRIISAQSFKIGTVRLLEMLGQGGDFNTLLAEYLDGARKKLRQQIQQTGYQKIDACVATGGNAAALGELAFQILNSESKDRMSRDQLKQLINILSSLSFEERIRDLGLRPDRADVILPAAMVFYEIMTLAGSSQMSMPDASLLDGIMLDMVDSEHQTWDSQRCHLIAWARSLKKKYHVDQKYGQAVAHLALELFDQSAALHKLSQRERLLLEIAAMVHEIGMYVRVGGHHRHAAYLISASPLLGLSNIEKKILAQTVRYQRKACPSETHPEFSESDQHTQQKIWQLSALLRLAIALNKERRNRVTRIEMSISHNNISLRLKGQGDMLLERWAALQCCDYIEGAFGLTLQIDL